MWEMVNLFSLKISNSIFETIKEWESNMLKLSGNLTCTIAKVILLHTRKSFLVAGRCKQSLYTHVTDENVTGIR